MMSLSLMQQEDILGINRWPRYTGIHAQMDYAVRKDGWLDNYCFQAKNYCYAAKIEAFCMGFSLLIQKELGEAEFRIAVHPDFVGQGYGGIIIRKTMAIGFLEHQFNDIFLIVRKNNPVAKRLYAKHGFRLVGETTENIQGQWIDFFVMKLSNDRYSTGKAYV